jgi:hypothetical protein
MNGASDRVGAPGKPGAIQPGASPAQVRSSVRLVASVAGLLATVVAKRTQRLQGCGIEPRNIDIAGAEGFP